MILGFLCKIETCYIERLVMREEEEEEELRYLHITYRGPCPSALSFPFPT